MVNSRNLFGHFFGNLLANANNSQENSCTTDWAPLELPLMWLPSLSAVPASICLPLFYCPASAPPPMGPVELPLNWLPLLPAVTASICLPPLYCPASTPPPLGPLGPPVLPASSSFVHWPCRREPMVLTVLGTLYRLCLRAG